MAAISGDDQAWRRMPELDFSSIGPQQGERFPDVVLPDQRGNVVDIHRARGGRRALIVFERSLGW